MLLCGNYARGAILFHLGELVSANDHQEKALAAFELHQPLPEEWEIRRLNSLIYLHFGLYGLGYPDRAWAKSREMMEVAQRSSAPYVLAQASCVVALHNLMRGDVIDAQKHAEAARSLAEEMGFVGLFALATIWHGASLIAQRRYEEGVAGMRRGFSAYRATGGTPRARDLCFLAFGLGKVGRPQEGLQVVEEGFASVAKTGEQIASPSLHHVKGDLLLTQHPDAAKGESCFRGAIEIARGAKCEIRGVAGHDEPRPAAREAGPARRGAHDARRNLRLVHRGVRYHRSERGEGPARRTERIARTTFPTSR
jgi:hypothetical protein